LEFRRVLFRSGPAPSGAAQAARATSPTVAGRMRTVGAVMPVRRGTDADGSPLAGGSPATRVGRRLLAGPRGRPVAHRTGGSSDRGWGSHTQSGAHRWPPRLAGVDGRLTCVGRRLTCVGSRLA